MDIIFWCPETEIVMAKEADEKFALSLKGDGISIEKDVDKQTALAIVAAAMGGAGIPVTSPPVEASSTLKFNSAKSLREFLTEIAPNTNNERITTIGMYLHEYRSKETFSKDDIESGFRSAREPVPSNLHRDLGRAVENGWIADAGEKGRYHITNTGVKAVENCFGRQRKPVG